jgi:hypothetical protein
MLFSPADLLFIAFLILWCGCILWVIVRTLSDSIRQYRTRRQRALEALRDAWNPVSAL